MEYEYKNIVKLNNLNINGYAIQQYHAFIRDNKWFDFVSNCDLRFFDFKKGLFDKLRNLNKGCIIKISTWDSYDLKNNYKILKTFNNKNFITPLCYFEYEEDIIHYLCNSNNNINPINDINSENSVVIIPYYPLLIDIKLDNNDLKNCIKQIILTYYCSLFEYKFRFTNITIHNIYIDYNDATDNSLYKISYKVHGKNFIVYSTHLIKFGEWVIKNEGIPTHDDYYNFYKDISNILNQLGYKEFAEYIALFMCEIKNKVINPQKVVDNILNNLDCEFR